MKTFYLLLCLFPVAIFGQSILSPIQNAVISENFPEIDALISTQTDWFFVRKPTPTFEGELLLDFALANNKLGAYQYLIQKGAYPGVNTVFTAVKSHNYLIAKTLIENGGLRNYVLVKVEQPRLSFSNEVSTNITAIFNTNIITNISQQTATGALGEVFVREYTNFVPFINTNFYTNVQTRIITNLIASGALPPKSSESPIMFRPLTNLTTIISTNFTNSYTPYNVTNALGIVLEREFTNVFSTIIQEVRTNIIQQPMPMPTSSQVGFQAVPVFLNRLQLIDLARLAETQGSSEFSSYFLEKAQSLK